MSLVKVFTCLAALWGAVPRAAVAQLATEPQSVPSPNASTLGLYGQVPVSQFTGLPSIQIPLYEVREGAIKVPISLSYHASGFRPDMHPGWVGVGWNLNAGGAITRTMHHYPDEMNWPGLPGRTADYTNIGFLYNFTDRNVNSSNWESTSAQLGLIDDGNIVQNGSASKGMYSDTEPDEFSFNFGEYSGKFYWSTTGSGSSTGKWRVQCNKPVQVTLLNAANPLLAVPFKGPRYSFFSTEMYTAGYAKTLSGFIITTEDGLQYQFGGTTNAIEYEVPFFQQNDQMWQATSWYLTKITATDGRQVNFNYRAETDRTFINQMYFGYTAAVIDVSHSFNPFTPQPSCSGPVGAPPSYGGQLIRPVYLSTITWASNTLNFTSDFTSELTYPLATYSYMFSEWVNARNANNNSGFSFLPFLEGDINDPAAAPYTLYNPSTTSAGAIANLRWRKLTGIQNYRNGQLCQSFSLGYTDNSSQRLVLNQVTETSRDNATALSKPPYVFTYNNSSIFSLPYLQFTTDHWGFYNATSSSLNSFFTNGSSFTALQGYFQTRQPNTDPSVYLSGVLTKIQYPTGGSTTFSYEQNTYAKQVNVDRSQAPSGLANNAPAGGLRIQQITSTATDGPSPSLVKKYYYSQSFSNGNGASALSSGILGGQIQYYAPRYTVRASNDGRITYQEDLFSTQSTLPACNVGQGSHIGYSVVTELTSAGGYTTSRFSNFDTGNVDDVPAASATLQIDRTPYLPYASREHERGLLLQEEAYNRNDQLVRQKSTQYTAFNKSLEYARAMQASYFNVCSNTAVSVYNGVSYRFYTYPYLPVQETEVVYDANGRNPFTTSKSLGYAQLTPDFNARLVSAETTTDSKGRSLYTTYAYPFDIAYPASLSAPTEASASALRAMVGRNIIGYPVETKHFNIEALANGTFKSQLTDAEVRTYKWGGASNASILPAQIRKYSFAQPIDPAAYTGLSYGASSSSPLVIDSRLTPKITFDSYDDKGNVLSVVKEGQERSAYQWGYDGDLLVAKATNALPGEVFTDSFEERNGQWDSALLYESLTTNNGTTFRKVGHAGQYAGRISGGGQVHSFSKSLTVAPGAGRYVFSGWVYSEGPTAQLWLFKNRPADVDAAGNISYYNAISGVNYLNYTATTTTGKWVYLEQEVDIPSDVTKLTLRLTSFDQLGTGKQVWFDDVRLHPAGAQVATYTHLPSIGVTSMSDANNKPTFYEYDGLNRLSLVRDQDGNIVKQFQYHYKNQ